jgi:hypothetical protein
LTGLAAFVTGIVFTCGAPLTPAWITTFNLRWWRHAEEANSRRTQKPRGKAGIPT